MGGIFISYRRQDSAGHARALYDRVRPSFPDQVFMDVAGSIPPGVDFIDAIETAIGTCQVLIVLIGREWISGTDQKGRRRLDDSNDFIRLEVATALRRDVVVIPVLVEGAAMPAAADLPEELARLSRRQAIELRDTRWDADVDELVVVLRRALGKHGEKGVPESPPTPRAERSDASRYAHAEPGTAPQPHRPPDGQRRAPSERERAHWRGMLGVLLGGLAIVGVTIWAYRVCARGARVQVPSVLGQSVDAAKGILLSHGLVLGDTTTRRTRDTPAKQVLEQSPAAGTEVGKGSAVKLVLAESQALVVPDVVGKDLEVARAELARAGFSVGGVGHEEAEQATPNSVLRVEPAPGTEITQEAPAVDLVVALAPDPRVTIPDLTGLTLADGAARLTQAGLVPRSRPGRPDSRVAALQVIGQEPAPGAKLSRGDIVTLVFNPKALLRTPDVVGQPRKRAEMVLQRAGFAVANVVDEESDRVTGGTVLAQKPVAGTEVGSEDARVELRVAVPRRSARRLQLVQILYPGDDLRARADGLAAHFQKLGWPVSSKGAIGRGEALVEYYIELDAALADEVAKRAGEWLKLPKGVPTRLVAAGAGSVAAQGGYITLWMPPAAPAKEPGPRSVTIFYPDEQARRQAEGLAEYFRKGGWPAAVKSGRDTTGARVEYFVERDAKIAQTMAERASKWLKRVAFTTRFVTPRPGTMAEGGGYFQVYLPAAGR